MPIEPVNSIIQNAIKHTSSNTILMSIHRWDYKSLELPNGSMISVDGGLDYLKGTYQHPEVENLSVWKFDSIEEKANKLLWGTRGIDGEQPVVFKPLISLTEEHLEAILKTQLKISKDYKEAITFILVKKYGK